MSAVAATHPTCTAFGATDKAGITHRTTQALLVAPNPSVNATLTQSSNQNPINMTTWIVGTVRSNTHYAGLVGHPIYVKYPDACEKNVVYFRGERAPTISVNWETGFRFFGVVFQIEDLSACGLVALHVRLIGSVRLCHSLWDPQNQELAAFHDKAVPPRCRGHWCMHGEGIFLTATGWLD